MKRLFYRSLCCAVMSCAFAHAESPVFFNEAVRTHPRLYISKGAIERIRSGIEKDPNLKQAAEAIVQRANELCSEDPIAYEIGPGGRLLGPAREALKRIKVLGMAYYLTEDMRYVDAGLKVMTRAAEIDSWNPRHFLDTATLSFALGLGYDWFYEHLTPAQREKTVQAIVEKGIAPSYNGTPWWITGKSNWNQVCNGGLGIAALAIWEESPEIAEQTVKRSIEGLPYMLKTYAPDGIYEEGPSYWAYGTSFTVQFIDALNNVMGHDFGLAEFPGFMESMEFINHVTGPTGIFFNYSDGWRRRYPQATSYWFAKHQKNPNLLHIENQLMREALEKPPESGYLYPDLVMYLLWSDAAQTAKAPQQLSWHGEGEQPLAVFRNSWDADTFFTGMKGGRTAHNHGQDMGGFVVDFGGVRWVSDLASENYNRGNLAKREHQKTGKPFDGIFYRDRWSHNILVVDGKAPHRDSPCPMLSFSDCPEQRSVIFDLMPAYKDQLAAYRRGMYLVKENGVVIHDELTTLDKEQTEIRWSALTFNQVEVVKTGVDNDGTTILLRPQGTENSGGTNTPMMRCVLLSPKDARFDVVSPNEQSYTHYYDTISDDARQILIRLKVPANTQQTITVFFQACDPAIEPENPMVLPLDKWGIHGDYVSDAGSDQAISTESSVE